MDQLTLSLATLVAIYGDGFRPEVFQMFRYI
jgi:hypothetical protein